MGLQIAWEAEQARKAYNLARAKFSSKHIEIEKQTICRKITLVSHFPADRSILVIVEIIIGFVENGVVFKTERLVYLKIKTNRWHSP